MSSTDMPPHFKTLFLNKMFQAAAGKEKSSEEELREIVAPIIQAVKIAWPRTDTEKLFQEFKTKLG